MAQTGPCLGGTVFFVYEFPAYRVIRQKEKDRNENFSQTGLSPLNDIRFSESCFSDSRLCQNTDYLPRYFLRWERMAL